FLEFVVEESLAGRQHRLKEYVIGIEVFGRVDSFDPRVDSIVRVEARRLRGKLQEYYAAEGINDRIRIKLRKGSYVPLVETGARSLLPSELAWPITESLAICCLIGLNRKATANGANGSLLDGVSSILARNAEMAERELKRAVLRNPEHTIARVAYVAHLASQGDLESAQREAEFARRLDPYSGTADLALACVHLAAGRKTEAADALQRVSRRSADLPEFAPAAASLSEAFAGG
ncbi:MAG TPA: tetratricopeptide repeat protein, partial [Candidatus Acidoferrales bacterium]|nr:tetratricopeptide repeat protein [Candidatus Acidoferrales bacterium]